MVQTNGYEYSLLFNDQMEDLKINNIGLVNNLSLFVEGQCVVPCIYLHNNGHDEQKKHKVRVFLYLEITIVWYNYR